MTDFETLIEDVALRLPDLPEQASKNLYDILGVRNKESINSRILAYFFDVNETHGLKSIFFDSIKSIIENKEYANSDFLELFNSDFQVNTEDTTAYAEIQTKKRIDISLLGASKWGIIIENKLYHKLKNPLKAYWEHTQKICGDNIIGVLLTLDNLGYKDDKKQLTVKGKKVTYLNITHKELINEVQSQLNIGEVHNVEGLFYLKEYIKTINSHYDSKMDEPIFNELAYSIIKHNDEIKAIQDKVTKTSNFLDQQIADVFAIYDYEKIGSWYTKREMAYPLYLFVPSASEILKHNKLWFTLEVRNEINEKLRHLEKTVEMQNHFQEVVAKYPRIRAGKGTRKQHTHVAIASIENVINENSNFKTVLTEILVNYYMGKNGLIEETEKFLQSIAITPKI